MTTGTKIALWVAIIIVLGFGGFYGFNAYKTPTTPEQIKENSQASTTPATTTTSVKVIPISKTATSSASQTVTSYFGNMVEGDFNGDGKQDKAFIITQTTGGSGTFFYLAHNLGGEAIFLGDRIAPQTTEWRNLPAQAGGEIIVNYAERKPGEPMTTKPSVGVSRYFKGVGKNLVEIKK